MRDLHMCSPNGSAPFSSCFNCGFPCGVKASQSGFKLPTHLSALSHTLKYYQSLNVSHPDQLLPTLHCVMWHRLLLPSSGNAQYLNMPFITANLSLT
jgi:hypothetical protein